MKKIVESLKKGDKKRFLENEMRLRRFARNLVPKGHLKMLRERYNSPKKKCIKDECSRLLEASTMKSRRGFAIQRLMNAMRQVHEEEYCIRFDCVTGVQTCFVFFSSRRRHTRSLCDWSSDVCSSDLLGLLRAPSFEIPEIGAPLVPAPWRDINTMTIAFGHGLSVSPLQLAIAASAVVNGGRSEERRVGKECRSRGSPYH